MITVDTAEAAQLVAANAVVQQFINNNRQLMVQCPLRGGSLALMAEVVMNEGAVALTPDRYRKIHER